MKGDKAEFNFNLIYGVYDMNTVFEAIYYIQFIDYLFNILKQSFINNNTK